MFKRAVPLMLAMAFGLATTASAEYHVGASFLRTDSEFEAAIDNFEPHANGFKIYGGCSLFKFLGLEATYRDLGNHQDTSLVNTVDVDVKVYDVAARGVLPVGKVVALFARAGYGMISQDGSKALTGVLSDFDKDDWELMYGVGVEFRLGEHLGLRAEWEEYEGEASLNSLSAGAFFRF